MTQKPVLISGAGLASLLLARFLLRSKIPFQIFERDASLTFRGQGYRLRLSTEGLDAIESSLDPQSWQKFYDTCGKTGGSGFAAFNAVTGEPLEEKGGPTIASGPSKESLGSRDGKVVGIARGEMRSLFIEGCEEYVQWKKAVKGYEMSPGGGGVRAIFSDGSKSDEGCLLVGGEGIHSAVAKQVSEGKLKVYDLGARGIHGQAPTTAFKGLGEGVFRIVDDTPPQGRVSIITNVRPNDMENPDVEFGYTFIGTPGIIQAPNDDYTIVGEAAANIAKELTKNWHERFQPLFREMNVQNSAFWKITCSTPTGVPDWPNNPRVTVIGDAAHSMTPAGGLGANTAVRDSALLGKLLAEAGGWADGITKRYEDEMRVYAAEAVNQSFTMATRQFKVNIDENTPTV
jgi:2-polyprenyl-6-methoxyphenol hydroxylase-like FAD-dependent oxidoreductase